MSVDQFEEKERSESKMKIQQWTNKRKLVKSWSYGHGIKPAKDRSSLRVEKGAVMIVHVPSGWLDSSYAIWRAFLQHISWRVSVESAINKRKSSCHFAWRAEWLDCCMDVCSSYKYSRSDIGLKEFLINQKLFLSTSEHHYYYQGRKWKHVRFLKSP